MLNEKAMEQMRDYEIVSDFGFGDLIEETDVDAAELEKIKCLNYEFEAYFMICLNKALSPELVKHLKETETERIKFRDSQDYKKPKIFNSTFNRIKEALAG